jgi:hypothetical protein
MKYLFNKKSLFFLLVLATCYFAACKKEGFLDQKKLAEINEQAVFTDEIRTLGVVNSLYSNLGISYNQRRFSNQGLDAACDESEGANDLTAYTYRITNGIVNASNADKGLWTTAYAMIRTANIFLRNRNIIPVEDSVKKDWTAQVRLMRAWYYFNLVKHYAGVPLVGDSVFSDKDRKSVV